jgi:hypothetical protein
MAVGQAKTTSYEEDDAALDPAVGSGSRNSPQYRHFLALASIFSAQKGHGFVASGIANRAVKTSNLYQPTVNPFFRAASVSKVNLMQTGLGREKSAGQSHDRPSSKSDAFELLALNWTAPAAKDLVISGMNYRPLGLQIDP